MECPTEALTRLDVSRGNRGWVMTALKGFGIGAVLGFGVAWADEEARGNSGESSGLGYIVIPPMGAVFGLVGGIIYRAIRGPDKWKEVPLPLVKPHASISRGTRLKIGFSISLRR